MSRLSSRVELRVAPVRDRHAVFRAFNPSTQIVEVRPPIPALRLKTTVLIGPDPRPSEIVGRSDVDVIIDTGAPLSIFPFKVWSTWSIGTIDWLELCERTTPFTQSGGSLPIDPPVHFETRRLDLANGTHLYWLGRVWLGVIDHHLRRLPAVPVTCWFVADKSNDHSHSLLGLHQSILEGRRLLRTPDGDVATQFQQQWFLEL